MLKLDNMYKAHTPLCTLQRVLNTYLTERAMDQESEVIFWVCHFVRVTPGMSFQV